MKISFFSALFFYFLFSFAQQSAEVLYKVNVDWDFYNQLHENTSTSDLSKRLFERVLDAARDLDFKLEFNPEESLYYCEDDMPDEAMNEQLFVLAKTLGRGYAKHYQNKKEDLSLHQFISVADKKQYREYEKLFNNDWQISQQIDTIMGFPVIKAVRGKETAWFTTNIPVPFGPGGKGGLPGLILQYQYNFTLIVATKIRFYKKKSKIKKPKEGILRTVEQGQAERIKAIR